MPVQMVFVLPWLLWSAQNNIFFPHRTLFQFLCPHRPAIAAACPTIVGQAAVPGRLSPSMCLWPAYIYLCLWIHLISRVDRLRPRPAGSSVGGGQQLPSLPPEGRAAPAGVATTDRLGRLCSTLDYLFFDATHYEESKS